MFIYTITDYKLYQFDVYADNIGEAFELAKEHTDLEIIRIERVLGI